MMRVGFTALGLTFALLTASFADDKAPVKGWVVGEVVEVGHAILKVKVAECPEECKALRDGTMDFHCRWTRRGDEWIADPKEVELIHAVAAGERVKVVFSWDKYWRIDGLAVLKRAEEGKKDPAPAADKKRKEPSEGWPKEGTLLGEVVEIGEKTVTVRVLKTEEGAEKMMGETITIHAGWIRNRNGKVVPDPEQAKCFRSMKVGDKVKVRFRYTEHYCISKITVVEKTHSRKSMPGSDYGIRLVRRSDGSVEVEMSLEVLPGDVQTAVGAGRDQPTLNRVREPLPTTSVSRTARSGSRQEPSRGPAPSGTSGGPPSVSTHVPQEVRDAINRQRDQARPVSTPPRPPASVPLSH